jgi:hypothetical protein
LKAAELPASLCLAPALPEPHFGVTAKRRAALFKDGPKNSRFCIASFAPPIRSPLEAVKEKIPPATLLQIPFRI